MSVDVESNCLGFNFLLDEGKRIKHEPWTEFCQPFRGLGTNSGVDMADIGQFRSPKTPRFTLILQNAIDSKDPTNAT
jgi:hypothetical protein